ncbi:MAG: hypothetical protein U9N84_05275, partial [Actinomycetota bacterium]|nr:hypothetical protein [Actinomycetota bacterium]
MNGPAYRRHSQVPPGSTGETGVVSEVFDAGRAGNTGRGRRKLLIRWLLQTVLDEEAEVVALVKDFALDLRVHFPEETYLLVLFGHKLLTHGRYLDVQVVLREVEIGSEELCRLAILEPNCELARFIVPVDFVEIQESREQPVALVSKKKNHSRFRRG